MAEAPYVVKAAQEMSKGASSLMKRMVEYRPSGDDASDPFFREALEQVERDPELKKWFANEMA